MNHEWRLKFKHEEKNVQVTYLDLLDATGQTTRFASRILGALTLCRFRACDRWDEWH